MNIKLAIVAVSAFVQFIVFLRWMYRRMRDDEINRAFIRDVALNHLPHLYHTLRQVAAAQGIVLSDPPVMRWVELNGDSKK